MKIKLCIKKIQKYFKYLFQPKYVLYQFESYRTKYLNTYLFRYILEILGVKKKGLTSRHARPKKSRNREEPGAVHDGSEK